MVFIDKKNVEVQKVSIIKRENLFVKKIVTECEPSLSTQTKFPIASLSCY